MDLMTWIKRQWDRVAAAALLVLGLIVLLLGYLGASGSVYPAEQLPYMISGGGPGTPGSDCSAPSGSRWAACSRWVCSACTRS